MWSGPIHDPSYVSQVLEHVQNSKDSYGTSTRMIGMLTMAKEVSNSRDVAGGGVVLMICLQELKNPFYFTPSQVAGNFHCISPSLDDVA